MCSNRVGHVKTTNKKLDTKLCSLTCIAIDMYPATTLRMFSSPKPHKTHKHTHTNTLSLSLSLSLSGLLILTGYYFLNTTDQENAEASTGSRGGRTLGQAPGRGPRATVPTKPSAGKDTGRCGRGRGQTSASASEDSGKSQHNAEASIGSRGGRTLGQAPGRGPRATVPTKPSAGKDTGRCGRGRGQTSASASEDSGKSQHNAEASIGSRGGRTLGQAPGRGPRATVPTKPSAGKDTGRCGRGRGRGQTAASASEDSGRSHILH